VRTPGQSVPGHAVRPSPDSMRGTPQHTVWNETSVTWVQCVRPAARTAGDGYEVTLVLGAPRTFRGQGERASAATFSGKFIVLGLSRLASASEGAQKAHMAT
jgi:hypothetical protein